MAGAVMALAGAGGASGGSGVLVPSPTPAWTGIFGRDTASSNTQTIAGIAGAMSLQAALSGGGLLFYSQNAGFSACTGAFPVNAGDSLSWTIINNGAGPVAGNLTVANLSDGGATLATIPYLVKAD